MSLYIINHDKNLFIIIYSRQSTGGKTVVKLFPASCPANSSYYWGLVCSPAGGSNSRRPRCSFYCWFFCGRGFCGRVCSANLRSNTYFSFSDPFSFRFGGWFWLWFWFWRCFWFLLLRRLLRHNNHM